MSFPFIRSTLFSVLSLSGSRPLKVDRRFGGSCRLQLQSRTVSQANSPLFLLHAGLLLGLFFDPEDGGDMFF
jgi:hypothetical protein